MSGEQHGFDGRDRFEGRDNDGLFLENAAADLVTAARGWQVRQRTRARVRRTVAMSSLAIIGVGGVGLAVTSGSDSADANLELTRDPSGWQVVMLDREAPGDEVYRSLQRVGIEARREYVATGPSEVGALVSMASSGRSLTDGRLMIPNGTEVIVAIGRLAEVGEPYLGVTDSFAPEEPLACLGGPGADAAALASRVPAGVAVQWRLELADPLDEDSLAGTRVVRAISFSADSAMILVEPGPGSLQTDWC